MDNNMARFRSELHVPIKRDDMTFRDRQVKIWEDVETRMEKRRKEWENDFDRMRGDFYTLKPSDKTIVNLDRMSNMSSLYETGMDGKRRFKVRFDVGDFTPEEIEVKILDNKLNVYARHQEKTGTSTVNREYSRQIDLPQDVDEEKLQCSISRDGVLTVDAPSNSIPLMGKQTVLPVKYDLVSASPNSSIRTLDLATPVKNPIVTEADGSRKLKLQCEVGEFLPDEIVVKTMDRKLIVHAEHEEKREGRTLHKEFNKEYDLPESVDSTSVSAYIGEDGKLVIEAPMKPATPRRSSYQITQSQDVRKVMVSKESAVTITDGQNRPVVTINVHRR